MADMTDNLLLDAAVLEDVDHLFGLLLEGGQVGAVFLVLLVVLFLVLLAHVELAHHLVKVLGVGASEVGAVADRPLGEEALVDLWLEHDAVLVLQEFAANIKSDSASRDN